MSEDTTTARMRAIIQESAGGPEVLTLAEVDRPEPMPTEVLVQVHAAGGVGHLAVQLAKHLGAYVIGTARGSKHAFVHALGADEVIDYTEEDFAETVRDVDLVIDSIGGDYGARSLQTLRNGGTLAQLNPEPDEELLRQAGERGIWAGFVLVEPDNAAMATIAELVEAGRLGVEVDTVLPFEQAAKAHELGETNRATGKIVLTVAG
ncbi:zinc-binding dehydrogenase [Nonomuraea sp. NPDC049400]|uniref:NADP-dependent oxidoreductase n=1 Tax=Nonomuraea sp. NPDC049400 TaxID=3364352 RepID=UPI0037944AD3